MLGDDDPYTAPNLVHTSKLGDYNASAWNMLALISAVHAARFHGFASTSFPGKSSDDGTSENEGDGSWRRRFIYFQRLPHRLVATEEGTDKLFVSTKTFATKFWLPKIGEDPRAGMLGGDRSHMRADKLCIEPPTLALAAAMGIKDWRPEREKP